MTPRDSYAGQLARQLVAKERYEEAANAFRLATTDDPGCIDWWLGLARCLLLLNDRTAAMQAYISATKADPGNAEVHNTLGCMEKHPRLAAEAFRAAVEVDPSSAVYRGNLAIALFKQWRFDDAESEIRKAMRLAPGDVTYAVDLGHMLMELDRFSGAKAVFRRAVRSQPHDAMLVGRAWQHYDQQRYIEAQSLFSHRARSDHDEALAWAYQGFGLALGKLGENRPALIAFRAAISLSPEVAVFHRNLGDALTAVNRATPSAAAYERARQLEAKSADSQAGWTIGFRDA